MATVMAQTERCAPHCTEPNAEPADEWKEALRKEIEQSLSPMFMEAKELLTVNSAWLLWTQRVAINWLKSIVIL